MWVSHQTQDEKRLLHYVIMWLLAAVTHISWFDMSTFPLAWWGTLLCVAC